MGKESTAFVEYPFTLMGQRPRIGLMGQRPRIGLCRGQVLVDLDPWDAGRMCLRFEKQRDRMQQRMVGPAQCAGPRGFGYRVSGMKLR